MKNLYLIGGGGHCHSCIDVIEVENQFIIKGIFDISENVGKFVLGYEVVGTDNEIEKYVSTDSYFLITVGQIKSADFRIRIAEKLKNLNANIATVISPRSHISKHAKVSEGTIVLHDALVNANVFIGKNCIINTKALIEHDSKIGNFCHISTAAVINGGCIVNDECFIGSNAVLREGINILPKSIVRAGSFYNGK